MDAWANKIRDIVNDRAMSRDDKWRFIHLIVLYLYYVKTVGYEAI